MQMLSLYTKLSSIESCSSLFPSPLKVINLMAGQTETQSQSQSQSRSQWFLLCNWNTYD